MCWCNVRVLAAELVRDALLDHQHLFAGLERQRLVVAHDDQSLFGDVPGQATTGLLMA